MEQKKPKKTIYKSLLLQRKEDYCPICDSYIRNKKIISFIAHHKNGQLKVFQVNLPYCEKCEIPSNFGQRNKKLNAQDCSVDLINPRKGVDPASIKNGMIYHEDKNEQLFSPYYELESSHNLRGIEDHYYSPFELEAFFHDHDFGYQVSSKRNEEINQTGGSAKLYQEDFSIELDRQLSSNCRKCGTKLIPQTKYLAVNTLYYLKVEGLLCEACNVLYVPHERHIINLLRGNTNRKGRNIQLEDKTYYCYVNKVRFKYLDAEKIRKRDDKLIAEEKRIDRERDELRKIDSAVAKVAVSYNDKDQREYIIVSSEKAKNPSKNILHYEDDFAMELLTAAFIEERQSMGKYDGKKFKVIDKLFADKQDNYQIILHRVNIKSDGGFPSSIKNKKQCLTNVLMYSPFTKRLEKIRATMDSEINKCYIDMYLFRKFVEEYGNPGVTYNFMKGNKSYTDFSELNAESILMSIGYTVSKKDNLSTEKRKSLLRDLVDLNILNVHDIIGYLNFFINSHPGDSNFDAREKWRSDLEYITSYKAQPERFLIAKKA